jgi:tetratricopeptide (TPR) repeat protein
MPIKCTSCGATQELAANHQCGYCGSAINDKDNSIQNRIEKLNEDGNLFKLAEMAFEGEDFDEAIKYYNKCLEKDTDFFEAWYKKGLSILQTSTVDEIKTTKGLTPLKHALKNAPDSEQFIKRLRKDIIPLIDKIYGIAFDQFEAAADDVDSGKNLSFRLNSINEVIKFIYKETNPGIEELKALESQVRKGFGHVANVMSKNLFKSGGLNKNEKDLKLATDSLEKILDELLDEWGKKEPDSVPKKLNKVGCFIATAAMGDYEHPIVVDLRLFRDNWLGERKWGKAFISWYYEKGPRAAKVIEKSTLLRKITFFSIVKPLHFLTRKLR